MKIYAIICTRDIELNPVTKKLVSKLSSIPAKVMLMVNQDSIFSGYKKAFDKVSPDDNDIFILCHDDIELLNTPDELLKLISIVNAEGYGFAGPAGTKLLGRDAVWWDQKRWSKGLHSGKVYHVGGTGEPYPTIYGPPSKVVALDGLFLAASAKTLKEVGLDKPDYLDGNWDFYDIHYTTTAHIKGFSNVTIPLKIIHHSSGEIVGREGWNESRLAFIKQHELPIGV